MPPSSATPVVVFSVAVVVVCLIGGVAGSLWPRPAGRLRGGCYFAFMGVAWVLLAISAIANAVKWVTVVGYLESRVAGPHPRGCVRENAQEPSDKF